MTLGWDTAGLEWNGQPLAWEGPMTIFVPRSQTLNEVPHNNDGTPRRRLSKPVAGGIAVHYEGAPIRGRNSTDTPIQYMTRLQTMAENAGKSYEYNYVNPPRADGTAQIWEYAGEYMAAHAGSQNNTSWIACLFAIGVDNHPSYSSYNPANPTVWQQVSNAQVEAFHWLVNHLITIGAVAPNPKISEHRHLAGAATTCPGEGVRTRWIDLTNYGLPAPEPEDDMTPIDPPDRRLDTRELGGKVSVGQVVEVGTGRNGKAAAVNFTVTQPDDAGFLTAWGGGNISPKTSNVNYSAGQTIANSAIVPLDGNGVFRFTVRGAPAHVIVDLQGVFG